MTLIQNLSAADTTNVGAGDDQVVFFFELILKGGFWLIPIAGLSIVAIYIFFERLRSLNRASRTPFEFMEKIKDLVTSGDVNGAKLLCSQTDSPIAKMIEKGIHRIGSPLKSIEASIENVGKIEVYKLEKNLSLLATTAGAAPMIGFLGTVSGMIQAFISIAQEEGSVSPKLLSTGIYEAMITTAAGLVVGIIAYLGFNYLVSKVQKAIHYMEYTSIDFIDLLQEPQ